MAASAATAAIATGAWPTSLATIADASTGFAACLASLPLSAMTATAGPSSGQNGA